jgi:SAM-dependent methyltransferase
MYPWRIGTGENLQLLNPELESVHRTRSELIETPVRDALSACEHPTAMDLACCEGWFSHRLLDWGAERVVGLDLREQNVRRATLMRDHFGIPAERLELRSGDLFAVEPGEGEAYDVVLLLGLIYHVEDPVGAVRRARKLTRRLCVIESQLTRQTDPIRHGWGTSDSLEFAHGSFATRIEEDAEQNPLASRGGVLSLIPNRVAVEQLVRAAGFSDVEILTPYADHNAQYVRGDRAVLLARP